MSVQPVPAGTYPGKLSNGSKAIVGVSTSITVFVGLTQRGPVNEPVTITDFSDFQRVFGGLWIKSMLSYTVKDFFLSGGTTAIIIRLEKNAVTATGWIPAGSGQLILQASGKGAWGSKLNVWVDYNTKEADATVPDDKFNFFVKEDTNGGTMEAFLNVSVRIDDARYLAKVLEQHSQLVLS